MNRQKIAEYIAETKPSIDAARANAVASPHADDQTVLETERPINGSLAYDQSLLVEAIFS